MNKKTHILPGILLGILVITVIICESFFLRPKRKKALTASPSPSAPEASASIASASPSGSPSATEDALALAFVRLLDKQDFTADTDATLRLRGHLIKGTRQIRSSIDIVNATASDGMQMEMDTETVSGKKTQTTHGAYYQGWYCLDDRKKHTRTKRSEESILSMVTFISDILKDASSQAQGLTVQQKGSDTICRFSLPDDIATDYFCQMVERAALDTRELKHVTGEVDCFSMTCRLDSDGVLKEQTASLTGKVSRSFFSVPVSLKEHTVFTPSVPGHTISPPDLARYKKVKS